MAFCWECIATLRNVLKFQTKAGNAQLTLLAAENLQNVDQNKTLSNLTSILIKDNDITHIYVNGDDNLHNLRIKQEEEPVEPKLSDFDIKDDTEMEDSLGGDDKETQDDASMCKIEVDVNRTTIETTEEIKKEKRELTTKEKKVQSMLSKFKRIPMSRTELKDVRHYKEVVLSHEEMLSWLEKEKASYHYQSAKHKCEKCIMAFKFQSSLIKHNQTLHSKSVGPFVCDVCRGRFGARAALAAHRARHYRRHVCATCGAARCRRKDLEYHIKNTHNYIYECAKCMLTYWNRWEFFHHYKKMHKTFTCDHCGKTVHCRSTLIKHIKSKHSPPVCNVCNKVFAKYRTMVDHYKMYHSKTDADNTYCVECNMKFDNTRLYNRHLRVSVKHRPKQKRSYSCPECSKVYARRCTLNYHYRFVHKQEQNFNCDKCDRFFLNGYRLRQHIASIHDNIAPAKDKICPMCGRGFSTNRILINHVRTHTGERPHACAHCSATFAQRTAMVVHMRNIHYKEKKASS